MLKLYPVAGRRCIVHESPISLNCSFCGSVILPGVSMYCGEPELQDLDTGCVLSGVGTGTGLLQFP